MTAMFAVIFMEQWTKEKRHWDSLIGLGASFACLLIFGAERFMIPSMLTILALLTLLRDTLGKGGETV